MRKTFEEADMSKQELKTLQDYEKVLQKIRLAHVEKDKDALDALFTEFYASVMMDDDDCYKIQRTPFKTLVQTQYNKIIRRVQLTCDSFEDVLQSVMTGIYDGSVFFRSLDKLEGEQRRDRLESILKRQCWWQINDFICNRAGGDIASTLRADLGIPAERVKYEHDGKVYRNYMSVVSMQTALDGACLESPTSEESEMQHLLRIKLSNAPIDALYDTKEKSPMEEVATKLAKIVYDTLLAYKFDDTERGDILLYSSQVQNPIAPELRVRKVETFASLPAANRFFNCTLKHSKYLGKVLARLSEEDLKVFGNQLDRILKDKSDYQSKKKLITACLSYIKDKQEEVA